MQSSQNESDFLPMILTVVVLFAVILWAGVAKASDKCDDPGLKPELKTACVQMEKMCAEIGCSVSVR